MSVEIFNDYIKENKTYIKDVISPNGYTDSSSYAIFYSFDTKKPIKEICFARLKSHMSEKEKSSNYFLRLPYQRGDKIDAIKNMWIDYDSLFDDMKKLVSGVYDMNVHKTGYRNTRLITFENKIELNDNLDYCLTLVLFVILRGLDREYFYCFRNYVKNKVDYEKVKSLFDFIYMYGLATGGSSGHDINDNLANIFHNHYNYNETGVRGRFQSIFVKNFVNTIGKTFSENGVIFHKNYQKYFNQNYNSHGKYGYPMQTECFNFISNTTRRIMVEDML